VFSEISGGGLVFGGVNHPLGAERVALVSMI
jgi:hypothetical protein